MGVGEPSRRRLTFRIDDDDHATHDLLGDHRDPFAIGRPARRDVAIHRARLSLQDGPDLAAIAIHDADPWPWSFSSAESSGPEHDLLPVG